MSNGRCWQRISAKFKNICTSLDVEADYPLFGVSTHNAETLLKKYIKEMTAEQTANLLEMAKAVSVKRFVTIRVKQINFFIIFVLSANCVVDVYFPVALRFAAQQY